MAGNTVGGRRAAAKNLAKDPDFYKKIGRIGGQNANTGGFAANPELARIAGKKGGTISRRTSKKLVYQNSNLNNLVYEMTVVEYLPQWTQAERKTVAGLRAS